jgi:hypothetical protein
VVAEVAADKLPTGTGTVSVAAESATGATAGTSSFRAFLTSCARYSLKADRLPDSAALTKAAFSSGVAAAFLPSFTCLFCILEYASCARACRDKKHKRREHAQKA